MSNGLNAMRDAMIGRMTAATLKPHVTVMIGRAEWPAVMEDVYHRVKFMVDAMVDEEEWVCRADALKIEDVRLLLSLAKVVRASALAAGDR